MVPHTVDPTAAPATEPVAVVLALATALILALVLAEVLAAVTRAVGRRTPLADQLSRRARRPVRIVLVVALVWIGLRVATPDPKPHWMGWLQHLLLIALILAGAWLVGALAFVAEDAALARFRTDSRDNRHVRRIRTQITVLRRLTVLVLAVAAITASLFTFNEARVFGAGVLASAGVISVIIGLAAQSSLSNVVAGLQLAFTDAIRLDDVVVVDGVWGRIEEITMTYVVVHVWDDRRLILPSTYFTSTPFENWTRRAADLLGTVELDVDWTVPVGRMRAELMRLLQATELWDHRVGVLQVTEAVGGRVRVRALASAADAPTLWDLRCAVREGLVAWLQREHPEALPRTRWEHSGTPAGAGGAGGPAAGTRDGGADGHAVAATATGSPQTPERPATRQLPAPPVPGETILVDGGRDEGLFTGSLAAVERSKAFGGPGDAVVVEREHRAEGLEPPRQHRRTDGEAPRRGE